MTSDLGETSPFGLEFSFGFRAATTSIARGAAPPPPPASVPHRKQRPVRAVVKYRRLLKSPVDKSDFDLVLPAQTPAPDLRAQFKQSRFGPVTPVQTTQNIDRLATMFDNWDRVEDEETLSQEQERRAETSQKAAGAARPRRTAVGTPRLRHPPKQKTSTHVSEVARQTTTKPLIFDLKATACFSMRRLGVLLHEHDDVDGDDAANTPAFRDCSGECVTPGNLRLFLIQLATQMCISYTQCTVRLCQLHSQTLKPSFLRPPHTLIEFASATSLNRIGGTYSTAPSFSRSVAL
jgi:hypothetical protein